jgi:hypothetical protein
VILEDWRSSFMFYHLGCRTEAEQNALARAVQTCICSMAARLEGTMGA